MRIHRLLLAASLVLCAACPPTGADQDYQRLPGLLAYTVEGEPRVEVPASAPAGEVFPLRVTTIGGSCRIGDEPDVERAGQQVDVRIWELHPAGGACDRALREHRFSVALRFDQSGTATVRVHGLRDTPLGVQPAVVERTVVIQ
jgi:hypothetical protein